MKSSAVTFHVTPFGYLGVIVLEVLIASVPNVFDRPFRPGAVQSYIGSGSMAGSGLHLSCVALGSSVAAAGSKAGWHLSCVALDSRVTVDVSMAGDLSLVSGEENCADIFSKALVGEAFERHRRTLLALE